MPKQGFAPVCIYWKQGWFFVYISKRKCRFCTYFSVASSVCRRIYKRECVLSRHSGTNPFLPCGRPRYFGCVEHTRSACWNRHLHTTFFLLCMYTKMTRAAAQRKNRSKMQADTTIRSNVRIPCMRAIYRPCSPMHAAKRSARCCATDLRWTKFSGKASLFTARLTISRHSLRETRENVSPAAQLWKICLGDKTAERQFHFEITVLFTSNYSK